MIGTWVLGLALAANGVAWETNLEAAFAQAKERNVPVLICFNMDNESANDALVSVYRDPEFGTKSGDCVCLIASAFSHPDAKADASCPRFDGVTCEQHKTIEKAARKAFIGSDEVVAPQHILVAPDRHVLIRRAYSIDKSGLLKLITMATSALHTGKTVEVDHGASPTGDDPQLPTVSASHIAELIDAAKDHNAERRKPAIQELGRIDDLRARDALLALLDPKTMDDTRCDAIDALATKGNYDALLPIAARLKDSNTIVVQRAIAGLGRLELPAGVKPLLDLSKKKLVSMIACEIPSAMVDCDRDSPEATAFIKKACSNKDDAIVIGGLRALAKLDSDADSRKILGQKLADSSSSVRGMAVWVIGTNCERSFEDKLKALAEKETNLDVRTCILAALRNLSSTAEKPYDAELDNLLPRFTNRF